MPSLSKLVSKLEAHYGQPKAPPRDPLALIIYENIGYLVDDDKRDAAFAALKKEVGLKPTDILSSSQEKLVRITKLGGIHAELRAARLKEIAHIVLNDFAGDPRAALKLPLPKAIKALKKFPAIGTPGAEKILLFARSYPLLALESNGLRVLLRLGFGKEQRSYSASYLSVQAAIGDELGEEYERLITTHLLLRRHGKELCKRNNPMCELCPLRADCPYPKITRIAS